MLQRLAVACLSIVWLLPGCDKPKPSPESNAEGASAGEGTEAAPSTQAKGTLPSGVEYTILKTGTGRSPRMGSTVRVHLTGWLPDGKEFLNTRSEGKPETYRVDPLELIPGLIDTLLQMKQGERRRVRVPSSQGYKEAGYAGVVPPNADLDFEIELVSVEP
jgi:FKBP-type peptidyl-prolyl cis-trans isomerase